MLRVEHLEVAYGAAVALQDCSVEVPERGCVAVLGANGAGKSTLLGTIARGLRQRSGHVHWDGACIDRWSADRAARAGIALVPEGRRLFPAMTVRENVEVGAARRPARDVDAAVDSAVERFPELGARLDVAAGRLSGGEQQMVALARALAGGPRLLLIDELSLGLAPAVTDRIYAHLRDVVAGGMSVVVVEQYADLAVEVAAHVVVLEKGRVAFAGSPAELRARPDVLETAYLGRRLLEANA
jgi:branched-chain amino acid transport system ATP-binding protein